MENIQEEKVSDDNLSKASKRRHKSLLSNTNKENNDQLNSSKSKKSQFSNKADKKRNLHNLMNTGGYGIGGNNFLGSKIGPSSFLNINMRRSRSEMNYKIT